MSEIERLVVLWISHILPHEMMRSFVYTWITFILSPCHLKPGHFAFGPFWSQTKWKIIRELKFIVAFILNSFNRTILQFHVLPPERKMFKHIDGVSELFAIQKWREFFCFSIHSNRMCSTQLRWLQFYDFISIFDGKTCFPFMMANAIAIVYLFIFFFFTSSILRHVHFISP